MGRVMVQVHPREAVLEEARKELALYLLERPTPIQFKDRFVAYACLLAGPAVGNDALQHFGLSEDAFDLAGQVAKVSQLVNLTLGETMSIIADFLANDVKYIIRYERNGC